MKLKYFAWVRERIGVPEEDVDLPASVDTVAGLKHWLAQRDEGYAYALENPAVVRVALDKKLADDNAPLGGATEAALFPPMTGG
ncbi:MAG: molybdopterin converting factor subunit 1 [Pseudomonadota bacterium]